MNRAIDAGAAVNLRNGRSSMNTFRLTRDQFLPLSIREVFDFVADPANLTRLTPDWALLEAVMLPPGELKAGTLIDYQLRLPATSALWQSEILSWEPPYGFVETQHLGPFSLWVHEHRFEAVGGGTLVTDEVEYALADSRWPGAEFVPADVERIFDFRAQQLETWSYQEIRRRRSDAALGLSLLRYGWSPSGRSLYAVR